METLPTCEASLTKIDDSEWNILFCCCVYVINPMAFLSVLKGEFVHTVFENRMEKMRRGQKGEESEYVTT